MRESPAKLRELLDASLVQLVELDGPPDRPEIPAEMEELFLVQGPRIFMWLIDQCEGKMNAERAADVSHSTMSRWVNSQPGQVFGQRQDMRSYRSIWFGYPSPFPGLDRIVEEIGGYDQSFLGGCVRRHGLKRTLAWMRGHRGFGLEMLGVSDDQVVQACAAVSIPAATRRRWRRGVPYPKQWRALDGLCHHVLGLTWFETVLWVRPSTIPRRVSKEALLCLIEESWEHRK
jgi:hypothetical protein